MNKINDPFKKVYYETFILNENIKNTDKKLSPIDDLTEENTATIDESLEENNGEEKPEKFDKGEFEDDGWGEEIKEKFDPILTDLESFVYEIRNCVRGTFTNCKTKQELKKYIEESLIPALTEYANDL